MGQVLSDQAWRRHANPWSVWTRFAAIPAMILAIWSRVWLGWWSLAGVAAVVVWLVVNPFVFAPVAEPNGWASRGIYGEKLCLTDRARMPLDYRVVIRRLIGVALVGAGFLAVGLWRLDPWPVLYGTTLVVLAQLWRIDRMGFLYEELRRESS